MTETTAPQVNPPHPSAPGAMSEVLFNAMQEVLTGNWPNPEDAKSAEGLGPFLLTRGYWIDGTSSTGDPTIGGKWEDCIGPGSWYYSERVMQGYVIRYGGPNPTIEELVRLYYGPTPQGMYSPQADELWDKVKKLLPH